jgi:multidrug efflux pump subunit AcrA (membrane-fusion protein)
VRANQSAVITWGTPGKIGQVKVAQGSVVKADALLAALDPASVTNASVMTAERDLLVAQRDFDNLKASTTTQSNAQSALAKAQKAYDDAKWT